MRDVLVRWALLLILFGGEMNSCASFVWKKETSQGGSLGDPVASSPQVEGEGSSWPGRQARKLRVRPLFEQ